MHKSTLGTIFAAVLSLPIAILPVSAHAERLASKSTDKLDYQYIDLSILPSAKLDDGPADLNGDGLLLRGSINIRNNFVALVELQQIDLDRGADTTKIQIGAAAYWPIRNNFDVIGRAGIVHYRVDLGSFNNSSDSNTGIFVGGRVRAIVAPQLELEGGIEHTHVTANNIGRDTYLVGEARYRITRDWSAGVIVNLGGNSDLFGLQARFNF